jgi:hypothetical protein
MTDAGEPPIWRIPKLYLLIPPDLAERLLEPLREFYGAEDAIEVIVDRRRGERRREEQARGEATPQGGAPHDGGQASERRRVGPRRAPQIVRHAPVELPRIAWPHAERLRFVQRMEPVHRSGEQQSALELTRQAAAGDEEAYATLYWRYFGRAYAQLRTLVNNPVAAETLIGATFAALFDELPQYTEGAGSFDQWLRGHVQNVAREYLHTHRRPVG